MLAPCSLVGFGFSEELGSYVLGSHNPRAFLSPGSEDMQVQHHGERQSVHLPHHPHSILQLEQEATPTAPTLNLVIPSASQNCQNSKKWALSPTFRQLRSLLISSL